MSVPGNRRIASSSSCFCRAISRISATKFARRDRIAFTCDNCLACCCHCRLYVVHSARFAELWESATFVESDPAVARFSSARSCLSSVLSFSRLIISRSRGWITVVNRIDHPTEPRAAAPNKRPARAWYVRRLRRAQKDVGIKVHAWVEQGRATEPTYAALGKRATLTRVYFGRTNHLRRNASRHQHVVTPIHGLMP